MPGKVNPVIPEAVNQVCFQIIGNDLATTMAAEAGQLQLNAFEPLIIYNLLSSLRMMTNACNMLTDRCVIQITANAQHNQQLVRDSIGIVTAFSPFIGYEKSSAIAKQALVSGRNVLDLIREEGLLDALKIEEIMLPRNLTGPSSLMSQKALPVEELDRTFTHMGAPPSLDASLVLGTILKEGPVAATETGHKRRHTRNDTLNATFFKDMSLTSDEK